MSKKTSRRRQRQFAKKRAAPVDKGARIRGISRAVVGMPRPDRPHSTKKGERGYDRKRDKAVQQD
jgi:hypothetical protein